MIFGLAATVAGLFPGRGVIDPACLIRLRLEAYRIEQPESF